MLKYPIIRQTCFQNRYSKYLENDSMDRDHSFFYLLNIKLCGRQRCRRIFWRKFALLHSDKRNFATNANFQIRLRNGPQILLQEKSDPDLSRSIDLLFSRYFGYRF